MQNQQISAYIQQHIQQGYAEADIRNHLATNGWPIEAIDQAFRDYQAAMNPAMSQPIPSSASMAAANLPRRPAVNSLRNWLLVAATLVLVGVVVLIVHFVTTPKTLDKLAQPALQQNAQNTARETDANTIAAGINQYTSTHSGSLPQTTASDGAAIVAICGATCGGGTKTTEILSYYKPTNVLYHAYTSDLTVPNADMVYIVNGAHCNSAGDGAGSQVSGEQVAAVVLYGLSVSSGTQQKCVSL